MSYCNTQVSHVKTLLINLEWDESYGCDYYWGSNLIL